MFANAIFSVKMFKTKKCKNIEVKELMQKINNAVEIVTDLTGYPLPEFKVAVMDFCDRNGSNGFYIQSKKLIAINEKSKIKNLIRTLSHEISHVYQFDEDRIKINKFINYLNANDWAANIVNIKIFTESFAYFNGSFAAFANQHDLNKKRALILKHLFLYMPSTSNFADFLPYIKNINFKRNQKNNKIDLDAYFFNPFPLFRKIDPDFDDENLLEKKQMRDLNLSGDDIYKTVDNLNKAINKLNNPIANLGEAIAIISFIANDFSILKTSEFLLRPWTEVLLDLNQKLNNEEQFKKIEIRLNMILAEKDTKLLLLRTNFETSLAEFIRDEIENK